MLLFANVHVFFLMLQGLVIFFVSILLPSNYRFLLASMVGSTESIGRVPFIHKISVGIVGKDILNLQEFGQFACGWEWVACRKPVRKECHALNGFLDVFLTDSRFSPKCPNTQFQVSSWKNFFPNWIVIFFQLAHFRISKIKTKYSYKE